MQLSYKDAFTGMRWIGEAIHPDNEYLCVSKRDGYYQIYNCLTGKPYIRAKFPSKEVAMEMGRMIQQWYGEYFWIWQDLDWRMRDLPELVQYTIPCGVEINQKLKSLNDQVLTSLHLFKEIA